MRGVEFGDDRLTRVGGEKALGQVHLVFHVEHGLVDIGCQLEFKHELAGALGAIAAECLQALQRLDFLFDRFDQQAFGILRRHAGQRHGDRDKGNLDVRVSFLGQADIGGRACNDGTHENRKHHAGAPDGAVDQGIHGWAPPAGTGRTFTPSLR